jgi:TRAP-type C4-dicarboxylate transport system permease small subunit
MRMNMSKLLNGVRSVLYWISVASMGTMLALIFAQVVTRYAFHYTWEGGEELARYLFVWTVYLGAALIMGEGGHLAVEFLPNKLKGTKAGFILRLFIQAMGYVFVVHLFTQGSKMTTMMMFQTSPALNIPMGIIYAVIPLSAVLLLLYMIRDTAAFLAGNRKEDA